MVTRQQRDTFARAMKRGVRIALGTDAGSPNWGPHPVAFKEMLVMEDYGMSREDVTASGTITAAEVLGMADEIGSIDIGKRADLLLLSGNPYEDLHVFTDGLIRVYKDGDPF